jgi:4-hydroxymandelate oxidase
MVDHMTLLPPLTAIPPDLRSVADYEERARHHIDPAAWEHLQGGAGAGLTLIENRAAFDRLRLLPRILADLTGGSTAIELFGRSHATPILLAPLAYQRLAHPDGELATVRAATAMEIGMVASTLSSVTLEEIAGAGRSAARELGSDPAPLWFQLYLQEDRGWTTDLVRRAEVAGYDAIVLTVDASIKRSDFTLPAGVEAANLRGLPGLRQTSMPQGRILFGTPLADAAPGWEDLAWLRSLTSLPLIVKGVLAAEDARLAVAAGADGLIISNHGGRVLDGLPSALEVMPGMIDAVGGKVPLLLDGGVRGGTDIAKALALGAAAVLIGRPQMHALAVAGMAGVAHMLHILRAELELAMAQLGCRTVDDLDKNVLFPPHAHAAANGRV